MNKINLILDIDDTLIKTLDVRKNNNFEIKNNMKIINLPNFVGIVYTRPYLANFLKFCYSYFNVGFWTAGSSLYCREILKLILTNEQYNNTTLILARDNNNYVDLKTNILYQNVIYNETILKPLDLLWNDKNYGKKFNKKNTLIIDNNKNSNFSNSIIIDEFDINNNDIGLCYISNILNVIKNYDDIRNFKNSVDNTPKDCDMILKFS